MRQAKSPPDKMDTNQLPPTVLAALLQALADEEAYTELPALQAASDRALHHQHLQQLQERLHRLSQLRAPWLDLGQSRLRWLTYPLNGMVWPWARKQAAFNSEMQHIMQELTALVGAALAAAETTQPSPTDSTRTMVCKSPY